MERKAFLKKNFVSYGIQVWSCTAQEDKGGNRLKFEKLSQRLKIPTILLWIACHSKIQVIILSSRQHDSSNSFLSKVLGTKWPRRFTIV